MTGQLLCMLKRPAVLQVCCDTRRPERVAANAAIHARLGSTTLNLVCCQFA